MKVVKWEIDMLDVGSADAILLHFINEHGNDYVIVVDAGKDDEAGRKIKAHIYDYYNKKEIIDLAICTHPDKDHIAGFDYLLENMQINEFWIHDPSAHISKNKLDEYKNMIDLSEDLKYVIKSLNHNKTIIEKIDQKRIKRLEPFLGIKYGNLPIKVLGPSEDYYKELILKFRDIDKYIKEYSSECITENNLISKSLKVIGQVTDSSSENNSSVVFLFEPKEGKRYLFTGDAGPKALNPIVEKYYYETKDLTWLKVPHHGSAKNLNTVLIRHFSPDMAYISCASNNNISLDEVVEALKEGGTYVYSTSKGGSKWHFHGFQDRESYSTAIPL